VPDPELYSWYSAEEAVSFFGQSDNGQHLCDGQWVIFPRAAICLAEIDKAEQKSYFQNGARFCWVADKTYQVSDAPMAHFLPPQVTAPRGKEYSIRLFARPPRSEKYLYAGELEPSYVMQFSPHVNRGLSCYYLTPTLPSRIWLELGGLRLGDLDVATVDQALDRLRQPTTVQDRLDVLQQLVNFWHGPIRPEDGMSEMELGSVPLPLPLRCWYRWAGKRADVMTGQNILFAPRDYRDKYRMLAVKQGRLHFYIENQGVYEWSTLPDGDDPPIYGRYECRGRWFKEKITLSEQLILMCLFEAVLSRANYGASVAWLKEDKLREIARYLPPLPIAPWRWENTTFFARNGAFMIAAKQRTREDTERYHSVWISAKTEQPLQFLKAFVDKTWEYVAL
jgi:hypothetical protein